MNMKQTKKQWLILAAVMSVFSAVMPTSCKDDDNVSVVADNKPWTISADDNGDYVGTLDNFRLYALCLTANEIDEIFESVTTGIDFLQNEESQAAKGEWFDLSGRRISHPTQKRNLHHQS